MFRLRLRRMPFELNENDRSIRIRDSSSWNTRSAQKPRQHFDSGKPAGCPVVKLRTDIIKRKKKKKITNVFKPRRSYGIRFTSGKLETERYAIHTTDRLSVCIRRIFHSVIAINDCRFSTESHVTEY